MEGRHGKNEDQDNPDTSNKKSPYRVLLIEDEEAHADLIRHSFSNYPKKFHLSHAATLQEARRQIAQEPFGLIIADLLLPDGKGIDIQPADKDAITIPVIIMTSHGNEELAVEMFKAGAVNYIVKSEAAFRNLPQIAERAIGEWENIRERKAAADALRESELRYRTVIENAVEGIVVAQEGILQYANAGALEMIQARPDEISNQPFTNFIHPDDRALVSDRYQRRIRGENVPQRYDFRILRKSGQMIWVQISAIQIIWNDRPATLNFLMDITDRKLMESEISSLNVVLEQRVEERTTQLNKILLEKETLLKEIHHRVKNNLQVIASLLNLQSQYVKDEQTLAVIKDSQNRIKAMALIHEKIYQSESLDQIDYGDYLEKITRSLFESYGVSPRKIALKIHAKDVVLHIDKAIPCSLIINELVSNSFKHAFPNDRAGEVRIDVQLEGDTVRLLYSDTGIGLPESVTLDHTGSLGMRLITGLVQQLKGTVEIQRVGGTTFLIAFKV